jgi:hypothetical protein
MSDPSYFFIIGAMKAGTTSLYNYLSAHPQLYASPKKEPRVFRDPASPQDLRTRFHALFEGRRDQTWCFEGSTAYTKYPAFTGVPKRIQSQAREARFVYLVRNPIDRIWSQYVHNLAQGRESRSLSDALREEPQYLNISRYHLQLTQYLQVFPRDRILVQVFEEMIRDPLVTVRAGLEFLDVDTTYTPPSADVAYNASGDKLAAPASLRLIRRSGLEDVIPWRIRHSLKVRGEALPSKQERLTPEVRAEIVRLLADDTEAFFSSAGRRVDAWRDFA